MSFLEDDEDIIIQTKKTKEILEMIKYILDNYYSRFEEVKKENNLLDYTDLELYTLRLLYNKRKDYSIEEKKEIDMNLFLVFIYSSSSLSIIRFATSLCHNIPVCPP